MPEKKINVIGQLFGALQKKKHTCEDIVEAADKVIEDYILSRSRFIRKSCSQKKTSSLALCGVLLLGAAAVALVVII